MPTLIDSAFRVPGTGTKTIDEYVGKANTGEERLSLAHMTAPPGWMEPRQTPSFDEWTLVLEGAMHIEHEGGTTIVRAGNAVHTKAGEWVRYSTPDEYTVYVAVCLPAFDPAAANRD